MQKKLLIPLSCLLLGCILTKQPSSKNEFLLEVIKAIEHENCSTEPRSQADDYLYKSEYKIDTTELYPVIAIFNNGYSPRSSKRTIGICRPASVNCEYCKELIWSLIMINNSLEFKELSTYQRIEKWHEYANTFTPRADIAYKMRDHYIRSNSVEQIIETYKKLKSSHRSFLLGGLPVDENLKVAVQDMKQDLWVQARYFH